MGGLFGRPIFRGVFSLILNVVPIISLRAACSGNFFFSFFFRFLGFVIYDHPRAGSAKPLTARSTISVTILFLGTRPGFGVIFSGATPRFTSHPDVPNGD